jgi:hypothetical protein
VHDLPPYVEATTYLPVHALVRGAVVEGVVLGWRGDRVYLTWRSDLGNHLGWVPASVVERRQHSFLEPARRVDDLR